MSELYLCSFSSSDLKKSINRFFFQAKEMNSYKKIKIYQEKDLPDVKFMVKLGADALENILNEGLSYTMNHFNC